MSNKYIPTTMDELARDSIIHDIDTNLFVEAGAGSGKTTMLVNRMVAMIEAGIPVEKICAITFTKNAALEFYERFEAKLIERASPSNNDEPTRAGDLDKPTDETRNRCLKALENIDLCFMGTIDSFCNMILSEHPSEANIPSDARLIDDDEASEIYKQFYISCIKGEYGDQLKIYANRFNFLFWNPENSFAILMNEIMDRRNVSFVLDDNLCIDFYHCFNPQIEDIRKALRTFNKDLSKLTLPLDKNDDRNPIEVFEECNDVIQKGWLYNYTGVQRSIKQLSKLIYDSTSEELGLNNVSVIRDVDGKIVLNVSDEESKDALLIKLNNYKYQNALKFVLLCVKPLETLMKQTGKFTYFDYLYYLRNTLKEDASKEGKLINYIYNRHSYFLIDEFQDTNPMQAEIFFYLTAKDCRNKKWNECVPKDGSLFIVGDPKQSIYRFRSADVSSYLMIKKLFSNIGKVKNLVNNFRSKNVMKQYFNNVFEEVMDSETSEQASYCDIENVNSNELNEFNGIYSYESYSESIIDQYPSMEDNLRIGTIIKSLVNNSKFQIRDKNKELRNIRYSDFMLIFSGKKNIASCISKFKQLDIPTRVEGKVLFEKCDGLRIIKDIYKAITDKDDVISLIACLKSRVFGLNDNDLASYVKDGNIVRLIDKEYGNSNIEKVLDKLNKSSKQISGLSISSLFEKIMDDYEIFRYVSSENLEIVYYALELIRSEEINGNIVTYRDCVNYLEDLLSGKSGLERCLSLKQDNDAVHIANLHKVKGLEAPIVILAKAGSTTSSPNIRIEYNNDEIKGYIISVVDKNSDSDIKYSIINTNVYKEESEKEKLSLKAEADRLVYVASTRARNVLIVNEPKTMRNGKLIAMANKWKYLKAKAQDDIFKIIDGAPQYEDMHDEISADVLYEDVNNTTISNSSTYSLNKPSDIKNESKLVDTPYENNDESISTLIGSMVHKLLESIVISKDNIDKDILVQSILSQYVTEEYVNNINSFRTILLNVYYTIHNGGYKQKNNAPQDILTEIKESEEVYSEVPFTYKQDNCIYNGIIDLIYRKDNKLHIIDWKTNKDDSDLDNHYKGQLNAYIKAASLLLNEDIEDALIYHIDITD